MGITSTSTSAVRRFALPAAIVAASLIPQGVNAQYGYPYGYRRRRGWNNVYIAAIVIPIAFFLIVALLWLCVFRAIFRRRRERQSNTVLPVASNTNNGYYPSADGYNSTNGYTGTTGYGNTNTYTGGQGGAASSYYNNETPQMGEAYTKPPQAAYHPSGNGGQAGGDYYAPPSGAPPSSGYGGGYQPPSGAPPTGYSR